jgi:hypothetical protein
MRKWGLIVSLVYLVIVCGLLLPAAVFLFDPKSPFGEILELYRHWATWIPVAMAVLGQATLLFLSVDTSWRRLKPRSHLKTTCVITGMLLMMLTVSGLFSVIAAVYGDDVDRHVAGKVVIWPAGPVTWAAQWLLWGLVFSRYVRDTGDVISRATAWLLKGSVLELLIAVPCHVIVRRRDDCSAPAATSFGITTGIAIMLLSFGPSVLLLFQKRMERYSGRIPAPAKK